MPYSTFCRMPLPAQSRRAYPIDWSPTMSNNGLPRRGALRSATARTATARNASARNASARNTAVALATLAALLLLAGCSSTPASTPSTALRPGYPSKLTQAVAKSETQHYANVIGELVPSADVASVQNAAKFLAGSSSGSPYYAVIRTVTLTSPKNALKDAAAIKKQLVAAGWVAHASATESNQYLAALASSKSKKTGWFLELGANTVAGQAPSVTVQIGSPDVTG
jgi:hypothetical protein